MSNPFTIAAKSNHSTPPAGPPLITQKPGPRPKPLSERKTLHALKLRRQNEGLVGQAADTLLAQFQQAHTIREEEKGDEEGEEEKEEGKEEETQGRRSHTREQKLAAVGYALTKRVLNSKGEVIPIPNKAAARDLGITPKMLRDWKQDVDKIKALPKGYRRGKVSHPCAYPEMEDTLHKLFLEKRVIGRRIGEKWIRRTARILFEELYPEKVTVIDKKKVFQGMNFSRGWFDGFLKRRKISLRQTTKKAQVIPDDYQSKIINWLQFNRRASSKYSFKLSEIANMDQTPIAFEFLSKKTYHTKGEKTVFCKQARSGWDRRQATLQIVVHADGKPRCKPLLIFHGQSDRKQHPKWPSLKAEYKLYDKRVAVMFNPKAWSNTDLMVEWIKTHYTYSTEHLFFTRNSTQRPPRFLSLDVFAGQKTTEVTDALKSINCTTSFIPGGTTGFIQVCDTAINKALKDRIEELADIYIDQNEERRVEGKFTIGDRRVLLTKWVGQAWEEMHQEDGDMIRQAFEQVGLGLPVDGSQDQKIKIKDFPEVQVGDWQSWRPLKVEGEATEELISNLTPTEVEKLAMEALDNDVDIELEYDDNDYIIVDV
jgi:hypothetical protein